jgi:hypothetical protein
MADLERPDLVHVIADHTPGPHRTGSDDITWWLPIIGPTASVVAHRFARTTAQGPACWAVEELARIVGLGGSRSSLWHSLDRLHRFGIATFVSTDTLTIRLWLPAITDRHLSRYPSAMAAAYRQQLTVPT